MKMKMPRPHITNMEMGTRPADVSQITLSLSPCCVPLFPSTRSHHHERGEMSDTRLEDRRVGATGSRRPF